MQSEVVDRFRRELLAWAEENARQYPWREDDATLYEVFVAEFFLTQTPAENVAAVYPEFLARFPDLGAIAETTEEALTDVIEPLGFYNMRAAALKSIAESRSALPRTVDELVELERVGPYVAHATLCFALQEPLPIVDRNVDRVYARLLGEDWPDRESEQWEVAGEIVPEDDARRYNLALLDFGAAICTPEPRCSECFASSYCSFYTGRDGES